MNKQEAIEKLQSEAVNHYSETSGWFKEIKLDIVTDIVNQLDEPKKPVLSKKEAVWLVKLQSFYKQREDQLYVVTRQGWGSDFEFTMYGKNIVLPYTSYKGKESSEYVKRRLVNAILYGYEVEKEKLYTAKLKSTGEYLHYDKDYRETRHQRVPDDVAQKCEGYHFTEDELIKYHAWENDAYEIEEVEE